jgi:DNA-binding HxlR family transcriptional regulator
MIYKVYKLKYSLPLTEVRMSSQKEPTDRWSRGMPMIPSAPIVSCPIAASLGLLGKKWTILIIRDIAMRNIERFSELCRSVEGITPRVLSQRLKELEAEGMIQRVENRRSPKLVRWNLTEKGWDTVPILMSFTAFGSKWLSLEVMADGKPREMEEVYPQKDLGRYYANLEVSPEHVRETLKGAGGSRRSHEGTTTWQ